MSLFSKTGKEWAGRLLICAAVLIAYFDTLRAPFIFDDNESILNNPTIWTLSRLNWLNPPPEGPLGGRPLANGTFALSYKIGGLDVFGFHFFNIVLHILTAWLLFALLTRILRHSKREGLVQDALPLALICALAWAVHPLCTGAVTYISQRTEELMGFFYLLALFFFICAQGNQRFSRLFEACAIAVCFAGLACKEEMVTAPIMILIFDRVFYSDSYILAFKRRIGFYSALFSSWIFFAWLWFGTKERGIGSKFGVHWYQYALTESRVIIQYLKLVFWPDSLVLDYGLSPYRRYVDEAPYALILCGLILFTFHLLRNKNLLGLAGAWFLINLAPTSSIIPVALQPMGENRVYLAGAGIVTAIFCGLHLITKRASWILGALMIFLLGWHTINRNDDYSSAVRIWGDTVKKVPSNARAYNNLGLALYSEGRLQSADLALDHSIQLKADWADPVNNKGKIALERGNMALAEYWFLRGYKIDPSGKAELSDLAEFFVQKGELNKAAPFLEKAMQLYPLYALNWDTLSAIRFAGNNLTGALEASQRAVLLAPGNATFHNNYGGMLLRNGRPEEATEQFSIAVRLKSNLAKAQTNLATMLARSGDFKRAITHYIYGLESNPNDDEARLNLGLAYQSLGNPTAAVVCYREVLRRNPDDHRAQLLLKSFPQ